MKITHYDLFAGIGGFSLALDTIFNDHEIKHIFCEWEAFPTAVLKKHWPEATYYGDIADLVADTDGKRSRTQGYADNTNLPTSNEGQKGQSQHRAYGHNLTFVTGGFPCQPFSQTGRRKGTADDRYKWPEMFAVIRNVKPDWVIAENVRGLVTWNDGMVLETVCADLESEGYEVQPLIIPAIAVGAPHRRDRVWIVAHAIDSRQRGEKRGGAPKPDSISAEYWEENRSTGQPKRATSNRHDDRFSWEADWREVALATCHGAVDDGLPRQMDGVTISAARHRKEQLKAYGNAIVPQVAMEIFAAIKQSI